MEYPAGIRLEPECFDTLAVCLDMCVVSKGHGSGIWDVEVFAFDLMGKVYHKTGGLTISECLPKILRKFGGIAQGVLREKTAGNCMK